MRRLASTLLPFTAATSSFLLHPSYSSADIYTSSTSQSSSASQSHTKPDIPTDMLSRSIDRLRGVTRQDTHIIPSNSQSVPKDNSSTTNSSTTNPDTDPNQLIDSTITDLDSMVPITAEILKEIYSQYPTPQPSQSIINLRIAFAKTRTQYFQLLPQDNPNGSDPKHRSRYLVDSILAEPVPVGLDSSMFSLRCACEEAAEKCRNNPQLLPLADPFEKIASTFESFQAKQREHVSNTINRFLPQDFRSTVFNMARQRSENNNARAIEELLKNGGTTKDKYKLMWEQQWKRRESLAAVGSATGIWRAVMRFIAGVPEPLLAFARDINSPNGPTDALRIKFAPALKEMTRFAIEMNALCTTVTSATDVDYSLVKRQLEEGQTALQEEADSFVEQIQTVIIASPFFVNPKEIPQQG